MALSNPAPQLLARAPPFSEPCQTVPSLNSPDSHHKASAGQSAVTFGIHPLEQSGVMMDMVNEAPSRSPRSLFFPGCPHTYLYHMCPISQEQTLILGQFIIKKNKIVSQLPSHFCTLSPTLKQTLPIHRVYVLVLPLACPSPNPTSLLKVKPQWDGQLHGWGPSSGRLAQSSEVLKL